MRVYFLIAMLVVTTPLTGCGRDRPVRTLHAEDVQTVMSVSPAWGDAPWKVVEGPGLLTIGAADGADPYVFGYVAGAARLSDGRIVVADGRALVLRYFDARGRFIREAGRRGDGPGEFSAIRWMGECGGDSIFVYDPELRRLSVFAPGGGYARSFTANTPVEGRGPVELACSRGGPLVVSTRSNAAARRPVGPHRLTAPVAVLSREGEIVRDLGDFPGPDRYRHRGSDAPLPLGKHLSVAIAGDRVFVGTADRHEVGVFSVDGVQRALYRWTAGDLRLTAADHRRYVDHQLSLVANPAQRRSLAAWYRDLDFPAQLPAYASFRTDPQGNLWVAGYLRPGARQSPWTVLAPDGRYLGTVNMPRRFKVFQVGPDFVLGRWQDSLDVQYVRKYPLTKG